MQNTLTLKQAQNLRAGTVIYLDPKIATNADGTRQRFKVQSVKLWKRTPSRVLLGLKRGMYEYAKISEDHLYQFTLSDI